MPEYVSEGECLNRPGQSDFMLLLVVIKNGQGVTIGMSFPQFFAFQTDSIMPPIPAHADA